MKTPDKATKRVLVVEDEPAIDKMCQRVLSSEGLEVDIATNGELAQDMISRKQYDLFLIDLRLPVISGRELYNWLKKSRPELTSKVILTSGDVMGGDTKDFLETTGQSFLPKPFTPGELKSAVDEVRKQIEK